MFGRCEASVGTWSGTMGLGVTKSLVFDGIGESLRVVVGLGVGLCVGCSVKRGSTQPWSGLWAVL